MKIAVNSRIFLEKGTGIPNYVAHLFKKCQELDSSNQYVFFQPNSSRTLGPTELAPTRRGDLGAVLFDCFKVNGMIRRTKPDIFHGPAHVLPLRKIPGLKYLVTMHDLASRIFPAQYDWKLRNYYRCILPRSLKLADLIVADSHNTKADIMRLYGVPSELIRVVHLAVADHFLKPVESGEKRLFGEKYLLSITTHPRRKNIPTAMRAVAKFAKGTSLKYVIAGVIDEQQHAELKACAEELGIQEQLVLFGYATDGQLASLYRHAEFLIYPSFYEGFGLPVLEAMASSCPVISSNTSSLPEIMPDKRWLVDPNDAGAMAETMKQMLALSPAQREAMIGQNEQHARSFTWEKTARQMLEIFQELAAQPPSNKK